MLDGLHGSTGPPRPGKTKEDRQSWFYRSSPKASRLLSSRLARRERVADGYRPVGRRMGTLALGFRQLEAHPGREKQIQRLPDLDCSPKASIVKSPGWEHSIGIQYYIDQPGVRTGTQVVGCRWWMAHPRPGKTFSLWATKPPRSSPMASKLLRLPAGKYGMVIRSLSASREKDGQSIAGFQAMLGPS